MSQSALYSIYDEELVYDSIENENMTLEGFCEWFEATKEKSFGKDYEQLPECDY